MSKVSLMFVFTLFVGANAFAMNCKELTQETQLAYTGASQYVDKVTSPLSGEVNKENCAVVGEYLEFHQEGVEKIMKSLTLQLENLKYHCPKATIKDEQKVVAVSEAIDDLQAATLALDIMNGVIESTGESCKEAGL